LFISPLANGKTNYSTIAFEADLPRIEASDSQDNAPLCNRDAGANCVNPPNGAAFYPFFTTGVSHGSCVWQQGGGFTSTAETSRIRAPSANASSPIQGRSGPSPGPLRTFSTFSPAAE